MKTITVLYDGPLDQELDGKIRKALTGMGCKWYAQGFSLVNQERDICFEYQEGNEETA